MSFSSAMLNVLSALTAAEKKLIPEFPVEIAHTKEKPVEFFEKAGAKRSAVVMKRQDLGTEEGKLYEAKEVSLEQLQDPKRKFDLAMWADDMAQARKLAKDLEDRRTWGSGPIVVPPALAPEHDAKVEQQVKVGESREEFPKGKQAGDMGKKAKVNSEDPNKDAMTKLKAGAIDVDGNPIPDGEREEGEEIGGCQVRIYDNGGETIDRYTVVIDYPDGSQSWLGASEAPFHPQGFGQHIGDEGSGNQEGEHLGKRVKFAEVPEPVQRFIEGDCTFEGEVEGSLKASEEGGPRFNLVWKGETIEEDLDEKEANELLHEYNMAYKGGVQKVAAGQLKATEVGVAPAAEPEDEEIAEFKFRYLGLEHEQYFTGFGVANTEFDQSFVGIGDSQREAAEDAVEMAAQFMTISESVGKALDAEISKMSDFDEVGAEIAEFSESVEPGEDEPVDEDVVELHVYVGLLVKTKPRSGEGPAHEAAETPAEEAAEHQ